MGRLRKNPILDIHKIQDFEKILPKSELSNVMDYELQDVILELDKPKSKISKQLKKYIIIRLVTMIETNLKSNVASLIDDYDLDVAKLFQNPEIPVPIKYFNDFQKKDFTKGKIVASNFNFQNSSEINRIYSNLLGVDFFETMLEWIKVGISQKFVPESEIHLIENWDDFLNIFPLRNEIIHTMKTPHKIRQNSNYFEKLWDTTWHFIRCMYNFSEDVVAYRKGNISDKKAIEFFKVNTKKWSQNSKI